MTLYDEATNSPKALAKFVNKVRVCCRTYDCDNCPVGKVLGNKRCYAEVMAKALTTEKQEIPQK